jgi:hypothetical protein
MPETPPRIVYEQVLDKYDWAEKHIQKLSPVFRELRDAYPMRVSSSTDSNTGQVAFYVENVPYVPSIVPLIAGDVLHSLRGALDYLACGLIEVVTPDAKFPIAHNAQSYKSMLSRTVPGIRQEALEALNSIKPYYGGNFFLWLLHRLNIIDKHRLLLAMCVVSQVNCFAPDEVTAKSGLRPKISAKGIEIINEAPIPLYAGKEFLTLSALEAEKYMGSYFAIGIAEPGLAEWMPLDMTLDLIFSNVGITIAKLAPFILR